jgi:hypothetical protein
VFLVGRKEDRGKEKREGGSSEGEGKRGRTRGMDEGGGHTTAQGRKRDGNGIVARRLDASNLSGNCQTGLPKN